MKKKVGKNYEDVPSFFSLKLSWVTKQGRVTKQGKIFIFFFLFFSFLPSFFLIFFL